MTTVVPPPDFATIVTDVLLAGMPAVREELARKRVLGLARGEVSLNAAIPGLALVTTRHLATRLIHVERRSWSIWRSGRIDRVSAVTYCWQVIKSARPTSWALDGHFCEQCARSYRRETGRTFPRTVVDF